MGITQLNFAGLNKVEVAIARLKEFEPKDMPYYGAYSGGKDSDTVMSDTRIRVGHSVAGSGEVRYGEGIDIREELEPKPKSLGIKPAPYSSKG